jgi:hypothetical protein
VQHVEPLHSGAPTEAGSERAQRKPRRQRPLLPLILLGLSVALFLLTSWLETQFGETRVAASAIGVPGFGVATLLALAGGSASFTNWWHATFGARSRLQPARRDARRTGRRAGTTSPAEV